MANFVSRNVLICVVPAVVILLSVYWFKKKKKMKPDLSKQINVNNSSVCKNSEVFDSSGSAYSPVESTSDLSNTLSDASSISSPESSRTQNVSAKHFGRNTDDDCIDAHAVSNHINDSYQGISVTNGNVSDNTLSQIQNNTKPELRHISSSFDEEKVKNDSDLLLNESVTDSVRNLCTSFNDALEKCLLESDHVNNVANDSYVYNTNLVNAEMNEQSKPVSDLSEMVKSEVIEEPIIAVKQNIFASDLFSKNETKPLDEPNIAVESDSHSHSSVLDENSLSSVSDDSDKLTDFKYKDSPSSVFDGNSISDESEKTDISNEQVDNLKYKNNKDYAGDVVNTHYNDPNNEQYSYSVQLNKNSFFKTILSEGKDSKVTSSCKVISNSSNLQHGHSLTPDNHESHSSEESFTTVNDDLDGLDQLNNQSILSNKEVDSENNSVPNNELKKTCEISSSYSESGISSSSEKYDVESKEQSEMSIEPPSCDTTVSSSDEIIHVEDSSKVNGSELDSTSYIDTDLSSESAKLQNDVLEPCQTKAADLDMMDPKESGGTPGLHVYEFDLPQELCGRLIGKQGKHVKSIKERTNANVFIKRHPFDNNLKTVVVEGGRIAVHEALEIIRRKFPPSQFPAVTLIQTNLSSHGVSLPDSLQLHLPEGASCDVILSSLVSAGHFFLQQPTHPTYPSLSTLDQCMISCYTQMNTPMLPTPVEAGVICAAPVLNGWFRAQIIYVYENRTECEIKFVDYGGFSQVPIASLRQIRSDFMTLPFQASECYLANVRPIDRNAGWSTEATSVFEELAQGQILQALLIDYAEDGIPCVHLYKVQGVSSMFINRELVERGLAVWIDSSH